MKKFLAVVKREYVQRVRTKFFVIATLLGPLMIIGFSVVPVLMFSLRAGGPTRLAIVDQTGRMFDRINGEPDAEEQETSEPTNPATNAGQPPGSPMARWSMAKISYTVERVDLNGRSIDDVKRELEARVASRDLDGYIILPPDLLANGQ